MVTVRTLSESVLAHARQPLLEGNKQEKHASGDGSYCRLFVLITPPMFIVTRVVLWYWIIIGDGGDVQICYQ